MDTIIIIAVLLLLVGVGLAIAFISLNKNKIQTITTYKKIQEEKVDYEIKILKNLKNNVCSGASDDVINNILNSENTILKNALNDNLDDADISKKLRK
ncbi:hypothetical protein ACO3VM_01430 [Methanocaldococcus sp. 10A]